MKVRNDELREMFGAIADAVRDAIVIVDCRGTVVFWNKEAERLFSFEEKEAVGAPLHRLIVPGVEWNAFLKGFERFKTTGEGRVVGKTVEVTAVKKGAVEFPAELTVLPVRTKEGFWAMGAVRDATARKKMEEELRRRLDEMERIMALMVGRELKMEELRKEIRELREKAGIKGR